MWVFWLFLCVTGVVSVVLEDDEIVMMQDDDELELSTLYPVTQGIHHHDFGIEDTGALLCSAFKNSINEMQGESMELTMLKGELARIVASYPDRRATEEDIVLEVLDILRRLIETLERDYINAIKEKMEETTEIPVDAWTDYHVGKTEDVVQPSSEPTEEPAFTNDHDQQPEVDDSSATTAIPTSATRQEYSPTISQLLDGADYGNVQITSEGRPLRVGSTRGIPGIHFPDYTDIPITSFSCDGKPHIPGFYADMETGCQVFHVCFEHRRESFLCPVGTIFNQPLLACDYWYSSNCSMSSHYYKVNDAPAEEHFDIPSSTGDEDLEVVNSVLSKILEMEEGHVQQPESKVDIDSESVSEQSSLSQLLKLLPVKARVVVYPETDDSRAKIVASASVGDRRKSHKVNLPVGEGPVEHSTIETIKAELKEFEQKRPVVESSMKTPAVSVEVETSTSKMIADIFKTVSGASKQTASPKIDLIPPPSPTKQPVKVQAYVPLTKLNARFIVKPVEIKAENLSRKPTHSRRPKPKQIPILKTTRFTAKVKSDFRHISPLTTKTLASGYVRLLKLKRV